MPYDFPASPSTGQIFQGWSYDGEKWIATSVQPNQGGVIATKVFTTNGTYVPSPNMTTCVVECVGGGGAGGGVAGSATQTKIGYGGSGGGYSRSVLTAAAVGPSQAVVIGAAGIPASAANGNPGSDTTFGGTIVVAKGGPGGSSNMYSVSGGTNAAAGTGDFTLPGRSAGPATGNQTSSTNIGCASQGGGSVFGDGGLGGNAATGGAANGYVGTGYGAGGGGGIECNLGGNVFGGTGTPGLCVITEYGMTALSASTNAAGAVRFDVPQGLTVNQMAQGRANIAVTKKNYIINGAFQINQGAYVSAAVLAAAAYGHDQWKAGASGGDYSFTQTTSGATITIAAGKSLIQPIEDVRVVGGGSYVLTWTGTAQARAGVNTLTPAGAYAASPLLITGQTDGTVMSVEFNTGTLGSVGLYEGSVAPPFQVPDYASELTLCRRYYAKYNSTYIQSGIATAAGQFSYGCYVYATRMRAAPAASGTATGGNSSAPSYAPTQDGCRIDISSGAAGSFYMAIDPIIFNARL